MGLDVPFLVILLISALPLMALYAALIRVNEHYAVIALLVGLAAVVFLIPAGPVTELVLRGDPSQAVVIIGAGANRAAGGSLAELFSGEGWVIYTMLTGLCTLVISLLMLRSKKISRATAIAGIACGICGPCIFLPYVGSFVTLLATAASAAWFLMVARSLFQMERQPLLRL